MPPRKPSQNAPQGRKLKGDKRGLGRILDVVNPTLAQSEYFTVQPTYNRAQKPKNSRIGANDCIAA